MSDNPPLRTVVEMNAMSIAKLDAGIEGLLLARLDAPVAVDAPPASYLVTLGPVPTPCLTAADLALVKPSLQAVKTASEDLIASLEGTC